MAYMSQGASPRNGGYGNKPSPRKPILEEGPIKELVQVIESTRPEQWQRRTAALADLVARIPTGNEYSRRESWFNSPPTLRHMHQPCGELLKDPRSTVVKRTCESLTQLFSKCQGDAKYLFKDLMPVVLNVHAQTVQVIRNQVQAMVLEAIPVVPCKMAMPLWLDRLKTDKSRTVREACVLYLGMGLKHWTIDDNESGNPYLSEENWVQIGTALIKTLRDPSPVVRSYAKQGIATIRDAQPDLWDDLIRDPDGPAGKDMKLQKWLIKVSEEGEMSTATNNEDLSVASRYSHRSYASTNQKPTTPGTPNNTTNRTSSGGGGGFSANRPASRGRASMGGGTASTTNSGTVPISISVGGKQDKPHQQQPPRQMRALGPPMRRPFAQAMDGGGGGGGPTSPPNINGGNMSYPVPQLGTPPRPPPAQSPHRGRPPPQQRSPSPSPRRAEPRHKAPLRSRSASSASMPSSTGSDTLQGDDVRSVVSHNVVPSRNRARPTPEAMNGGLHVAAAAAASSNGSNSMNISPDAPSRQVIDLVDQPSPQGNHINNNNTNKPSPPEHHQQDPPTQQQRPVVQQEYSSGVYSHASSTEMLDVTKSIDQTLAHLETQPNSNTTNLYLQQQQHQQHQQQPQLQQQQGGIHFHPQLPMSPTTATQQQQQQHPPPVPPPQQQHQQQQQEGEGGDGEGPFIASMNELKQHASRRRSRRSIHMKERWSRGESIGSNIMGSPTPLATTVPTTPADAVSSLGGSMMYHQEDASKPLPPTPALPEHYIIAEQLLRVHKTHVDQIMETLKIEMDTLRDFEQSLEQEQSPSPDQVLDYFESVGLCLDQRTTAGNILQREMDRISKGAFSAANAAAAAAANMNNTATNHNAANNNNNAGR